MEQSNYGNPAPPVKRKKTTLVFGIAISLFIILLLLIAIPIYLRYVEKNRSVDAQEAINSIRKAYDIYRSQNGTLEGFTAGDAIEEAGLSTETLDKWDFDVVMKTTEDIRRGEEYNRTHPDELLFGRSPFKYFIATSKQADRKGQNRLVWYTPDTAKFHGYGIDLFTDPEADFEYLESVELDVPQATSSGSRLSRYAQRSLSSEAQTAINTLRKAYQVYMQTNGTTEGYTVGQALREANLEASTMRNWNFSTISAPPRIYLAESTAENKAGAGYKVWFDVNEAKFHGFGVDQLTQP